MTFKLSPGITVMPIEPDSPSPILDQATQTFLAELLHDYKWKGIPLDETLNKVVSRLSLPSKAPVSSPYPELIYDGTFYLPDKCVYNKERDGLDKFILSNVSIYNTNLMFTMDESSSTRAITLGVFELFVDDLRIQSKALEIPFPDTIPLTDKWTNVLVYTVKEA